MATTEEIRAQLAELVNDVAGVPVEEVVQLAEAVHQQASPEDTGAVTERGRVVEACVVVGVQHEATDPGAELRRQP